MPPHLPWDVMALRLGLTVVAGAVVGLDRGEHGHVAGLRTTILVSLAAALAMLQVEALLPLTGKAADSYIVMDLMRLPLGILSGMGFIGAGAILRRGSAVIGVTTAATLWVMTVIGLCFGGGQLALGCVVTALVVLVLWGLRYVERKVPRDRRATLVIVSQRGEGLPDAVRASLAPGLHVRYLGGTYDSGRVELRYDIRWRGAPMEREPSAAVERLLEHAGVESIRWDVEYRDS
jgi:putative Mg2+ transporter-C (MgtC) family protein